MIRLITCTKTHPVDEDDEGRQRFADAGENGKATRQEEVAETEGHAWNVAWDNGAWGFYSTAELNAVSEETKDGSKNSQS